MTFCFCQESINCSEDRNSFHYLKKNESLLSPSNLLNTTFFSFVFFLKGYVEHNFFFERNMLNTTSVMGLACMQKAHGTIMRRQAHSHGWALAGNPFGLLSREWRPTSELTIYPMKKQRLKEERRPCMRALVESWKATKLQNHQEGKTKSKVHKRSLNLFWCIIYSLRP